MSRRHLILVAIAAVALLVRLAALLAIDATPLAGDEGDYFRRAVRVLEDGRIAQPGERAPLTELWYAALFWCFGTGVTVARVGNALLGALTIVPIFCLGRALLDARAGLWAAGLAALYPNFIAFSHYLWGEVLYLFLVASALALLARAGARPAWPSALAAGGLLGLAALTREVGVVFPVVAAAWIVWTQRQQLRSALAGAGALLAGVAVVLAPWVVTLNTGVDDFAWVTRTANMNLYIGNTGPVRLEDGSWIGPNRHYWTLGSDRISAEREAGRLARAAIAERLPGWPFEKLAEQVPRFLTPTSFAVRRLLTDANDAGPHQSWSYRFAEVLPDSPALRFVGVAIVVAGYLAVLLLGTVGLLTSPRRAAVVLCLLFVASQLLPTIVTFAASRFRLASMVVLLAAAGSQLRGQGTPFLAATTVRRRMAVLLAVGLLAIVASRYQDALRATWG